MAGRVGRVVLLHPDVNFDGTFRSLAVCAQVVFLRLLPFLDDAGRLPREKGIGLTANIHHRLGLPPADVEAAVAELVERQMIVVEGDVLSVPRFAPRQRDAAFLLPSVLSARFDDPQIVRDFVMALAPLFERAGFRLLGAQEVSPAAPDRATQAGPSGARPAPAQATAPVDPAHAEEGQRRGRTTVPRLPGESDGEYAKRVRSLRNQRAYRAKLLRESQSSEGSHSVDGPSNGKRLNQSVSVVQTSDGRQSSDGIPRASDVGPKLSTSESPLQTGTIPPSSTSPGSGGEEGEGGDFSRKTREGIQTTMRPKTTGEIQTFVPRPAQPSYETMLGDEVAQQISRACAGLFFPIASASALRELGRVNALLGQQGVRDDRWKIFGEYILAGGYAGLHEPRFRRRLRGEVVMVPDLDMLIKTVSAATPDGGRTNEMDTARLTRGLNSALVWDEQGRPDLRVRGSSVGRGGLERVAAPSNAKGRIAGDDLAREGGSGSSASGAVGLVGDAADDLLSNVLGGGRA